jgi:lambda repressor-like predicted transcriptional regulator
MNECDSQNYTPAKIQYQLKLAGITQAKIAHELGVSPMVVSDIINYRKISDRVMRAVARKIGADHRDVFAWYYRSDRQRRSKRAA